MLRPIWRPWLKWLRARQRRQGRSSGRSVYRPTMEPLEDRTAPAFNLTLSFEATTGLSREIVANAATYEANSPGANLSWNDIVNDLLAGRDVVVDSGTLGAEAGDITSTVAVRVANSSS